MTTALAKPPDASALEKVLVSGDLNALTPPERLAYYRAVCDSVGLNPLTQPFDYLKLSGKLVLYAKKGCADQLRRNHQISLSKPDVQFADGLAVVSITATAPDGRTDSDVGAVPLANLQGEARANAIMKAVTKAKRRTTLSICGLGMLDESEIESIPDARPTEARQLPEKEETPPVDRARVAATLVATIAQADSLADLTALWKSLPAPKGFLAVKDEHTAAVVAAKDARKAALAQPAPTLDQLRDEIDDLCRQLGFDSMQLTLAEQACGIDDPASITDVQAAKLVTYLRHELKGAVPV